MAQGVKFASITYGSDENAGEKKQYTYLVSANVRTKDQLQVAVKHWKSQKIFGTTGVVQGTSNSLDNLEKSGKIILSGKKGDKITQNDIIRAYTGKELGLAQKNIERARDIGGRYQKETELTSMASRTRGGNELAYQQQLAQKGITTEISDTEKAQNQLFDYNKEMEKQNENL